MPKDMMPIVRAAAELRCSYLKARDLALCGKLELHWGGPTGRSMYVTVSSVQRLKSAGGVAPLLASAKP